MKRRTKEVVTEAAKFGCRLFGGLGAGLVVGTALMGVDTRYLGKGLQAICTFGSIGLADYFGEKAGKQLEHRVDSARACWDLGEKFAEKIDKVSKEEKDDIVLFPGEE